MTELTTESGPDLPAGYRLGDFEIQAVAGRGAMGVVYRASQLSLGRVVALKVVAESLVGDAGFRARFEREARAAAALGHPNIVSVHEAGQIGGVLYIAMQWVEGGDLRHHIATHGPMAPKLAVRVVTQIADALDVAHATGVLHRDVKPANILMSQMATGVHAYLTDFGVTRPFVELRGGSDGLTESGHIVGTPGFLAPEQIEGRDIDGRADLYALGCVLFEALTGLPPFRRETPLATLLAHTSAPRPLVSGANPRMGKAFDEVVCRAIAVEPDDRFPDGRALATAVEQASMAATRLPPVRPLPHLPTLGLSRPEPSATPAARRLVIELDDGEHDSVPVRAKTPVSVSAATVVPPPATTATTWPVYDTGSTRAPADPARRGRLNAMILLAALALVLGVVLAIMLSGGEPKNTLTDTTTLPAAQPQARGPVAATAMTGVRIPQRTAIVTVLRRYARALSADRAEAMGDTMTTRVMRTTPGDALVCASGRDAVTGYYKRVVFNQITDFTLPGLQSKKIDPPIDGKARVQWRARTTTPSGSAERPSVTFSLQKAGRDWRISKIQGPGC